MSTKEIEELRASVLRDLINSSTHRASTSELKRHAEKLASEVRKFEKGLGVALARTKSAHESTSNR